MADTVDTITLFNGSRRVVRRFTGISDGTGESAVVKFDKSAFTNGNGVEPGKLGIEWVEWNIQGYTSIRFFWDHTTDDEALILSGTGEMDFRTSGGLWDPASAGDTGDLIMTTAGHAANATYTITMSVLKSN